MILLLTRQLGTWYYPFGRTSFKGPRLSGQSIVSLIRGTICLLIKIWDYGAIAHPASTLKEALPFGIVVRYISPVTILAESPLS